MEKKNTNEPKGRVKGRKSPENAQKKQVKKRCAHRASLIHRTAEITGKSENYVWQVMNDRRRNDEIFLVYMELSDGMEKVVATVKTLLPFSAYQDIELEVAYKRYDEALA